MKTLSKASKAPCTCTTKGAKQNKRCSESFGPWTQSDSRTVTSPAFFVPRLTFFTWSVRSRSRQNSGCNTVRPLNSGEPSYDGIYSRLSLGESRRQYKLAAQASASTRTACEENKNTEAQRTQSYPSHLPSVTSVPLCFKSTRPKGIAKFKLCNFKTRK